MTEAEWLAATDPEPMLAFLRERAEPSQRKSRLFAVACCRRVWHLLGSRGRGAVDMAEQLADENTTRSDEDRARQAVGEAAGEAADAPWDEPERAALRAAWVTSSSGLQAGWVSRWVRDALEEKTRDSARRDQVSFFRCVFGNPFRPARSLAPAVLAWNAGTIPRLAQAIYDERAFDRLPFLADALEDAGCADAEILGHCRSGGEHVRGCWVVDLVLGKG